MSKIKNIEQKIGVCKNAPVPSKSQLNFETTFIWEIETDILWGWLVAIQIRGWLKLKGKKRN